MSSGPSTLRIGTRGSALARWQADKVAAALSRLPGVPEPELVLIKTEGDRIQDVPLSRVQGNAFFTKEIEAALLKGQVDVAVHSLKDLATEMPEGLALGAVLERGDPRDVLLASAPMALKDLAQGARVGTSSLRRRALLARWRPDLELAELRGNVPTRIEKLDQGDYDAIVLAAAGVKRLGLGDRISAYLPFEFFLPAASQGAIGVQIRAGKEEILPWVESLDHGETRWATTAERAFLRTIEGGCHVPVGAFAELAPAYEPGESPPRVGQAEAAALGSGRDPLGSPVLGLRGVVCSLDGLDSVEGEISGLAEDAASLGSRLAEDLISRGGGEILEKIRKAGGER